MAKELFERIDRQVKDLLTEVTTGKMGLPDLQRPFVWPDNKVRDLLDSMIQTALSVSNLQIFTAESSYSIT